MTKRKVGVLISGNGSNLQALIDACADKNYPAEISVVISNRADAYGINRAREHGIPAHILNHRDYPSREAFDAAMHELLEHHNAEIICLAGFMRLLSPWFVQHWQGRLLNIHPSLLPDFKGELDSGPVLLQARVKVLPGDSEESLHARIHEQEHKVYPQALKQLVEQYK